jgi:hypothetical protein
MGRSVAMANNNTDIYSDPEKVKRIGFTHDDKNNKTVDWWTPPWVFEYLGETFDLDVSAPDGGVPWIPANNYFTVEDDGLTQPWHGFVWCNPPYGPYTPQWMAKFAEHKNGIALVFARTDCKWFHDYCVKADAILFLKGRVQFIDGLGKTKGGGAGAGSMLIGFGERAKKAILKLRHRGFLVSINGEQ